MSAGGTVNVVGLVQRVLADVLDVADEVVGAGAVLVGRRVHALRTRAHEQERPPEG